MLRLFNCFLVIIASLYCTAALRASDDPILSQPGSEPLDIAWHKAMGSSQTKELGYDIAALPSGGAVLSYRGEGLTGHLRRIDENGETVWDYDYPYEDFKPIFQRILVLPDQSIIGVGSIFAEPGPDEEYGKFQPYAIQVTRDGALMWQKHYAMPYATNFQDVAVTAQGDFIFAGTIGLPFVGFGGAVYLTKVKDGGKRAWQQVIMPPKTETSFSPYHFGSMILDQNDQIIINARYGGTPKSISVYDNMVHVVARFSQKGKLISKREFGDERWEVANDALIDDDNNMIIGGMKTFDDESQSGVYISAFSPDDEIIWEQVINEPVSGLLNGLKRLPNGDLIGAGSYHAQGAARKDPARFADMIIISLSGDGQYLWSKQYANLARYGIKAMDVSQNGEVWVLGELGTSNRSDQDLYVAKLAPQ